MHFKKIGFIGGGRVTAFLLSRLKKNDGLPEEVIVSDPNSERHHAISQIDPRRIHCTTENTEPARTEVVFFAVHPPVVPEVCTEIKSALTKETFLVSLIPTIPLARLTELLDGFDCIVRMIPTAPSLIGKGYNPVVYSPVLSFEEKKKLQFLFAHWGESPEVPESHLETYVILTGMGPTYFWFQWLTLLRLGKAFGLSDHEVKKALVSMIHGAIDTLFASGLSEAEVLDLIPAYPLKKDEETIQKIYEERLTFLAEKLHSATRVPS